jgi:hypothetical protein
MWYVYTVEYYSAKNKNEISRAPVILATQGSEIRRLKVQSQHGQMVMSPYLEKTLHRKGLVEWLKV